jgi:arginyl-tRNA synthetase
MQDAIFHNIEQILHDAGIPGAIELLTPPNPDMGDISFACFALAKKQGRNPAEVAKELAEEISLRVRPSGGSNPIEKIQAAGPYVNFYLKAEAVAQLLFQAMKKEKSKFGNSALGKGQKVVIEYSQPNTHKEFHVGHLRNAALGLALVKLYQASGYKVKPVTYPGDIGAHVAKCLWALQKFHAAEKPPLNKGQWLGKIYTEASRFLDEHPEVKNEVQQVQQLLESGGEPWVNLWKRTRQWSLTQFKDIYDELGITFDYWFFESQVEKQGKKIVNELLQKGIAERGEGGAVIVNLKQYGLEVFLILKSDGTSLYATKDLALAKRKFAKYKPDLSLNIVDIRQSLYFKQLFKTLALMGFEKPMKHIPYEFVKLPQGVISSRHGLTVLYEDLRDQMVAYAAQETKKRHSGWSEKKVQNTAKALALGAMKFGMLKVRADQVITFDIKSALSFDGCTGPYLQYSLARIFSIFKKAGSFLRGFNPSKGRTLKEKPEKRLIMRLLGFQEIISQATQVNDPSLLAKYLYELARESHDFYEQCPVLKAESLDIKCNRLELLKAVQLVLVKGLGILGIPILKEM